MNINEGFWAVQGWKSHVGLPLLLPPLMEVQVHIMRNGSLTLEKNAVIVVKLEFMTLIFVYLHVNVMPRLSGTLVWRNGFGI